MWDINNVIEEIREKLSKQRVAQPAIDKQCIYHEKVLSCLETTDHCKCYDNIDFVGAGGSGVVVKLYNDPPQNISGTKCLKYPHSLAGTEMSFSLADVLSNESEVLMRIHHQNILPVDVAGKLDLSHYDDIDERDKTPPYYLMPFVDAIDLGEYAKTSYAKNDLLVNLLFQAAVALEYLHDQNYLHMDVKPGNIFIEDYRGDNPRALLADFGFCKNIVPLTDKSTLIMGTYPYMHPDLIAMMTNMTQTNLDRARDRISRNALKPEFDRYSFGLTIMDTFIAYLHSKDCNDNFNTLNTGIYRGLMFIVIRCLDGHTEKVLSHPKRHKMISSILLSNPNICNLFKYNNTFELASNLQTLSDRFRGIYFIPEINDSSKSNLCVPPRNLAPLSYRVRKTIDSIPVRRLSSVSQLAFCYHIYPGASHNRKEHVIGVYQTTCKLLRYLLLDLKNPICALLLSEKHQKIALLASLFHDIGHVPLMHEFEDSIPNLKQEIYMAEIFERKWGDNNFQDDIDEILKLW